MERLSIADYYPQQASLQSYDELLQYASKHHAKEVAYKFRLQAKGEVQERRFETFIQDSYALKKLLYPFVTEWEKLGKIYHPKKKAKIAIIGANSYFWRLAYMATALTPAFCVPLDKLLKYAEVKNLLDRVEPEVLFYDGAFHEQALQLQKECPYLRMLICMNRLALRKKDRDYAFSHLDAPMAQDLKKAIHYKHLDETKTFGQANITESQEQEQTQALEDEHSTRIRIERQENQGKLFLFEDLLEQAYIWQEQGENYLQKKVESSVEEKPTAIHPLSIYAEAKARVPQPEEASILIFTSGTTEQSKAIVLSQANICSNILSLARVVSLPERIRCLSLLPLHHTFENTCGFLVVFYLGGCVCDSDGLRYIADNMKEYQPNLIISVPLIFEHFYNRIQMNIREKKAEKKIQTAIKISRFLRKFGLDLRYKFFKEIHQGLGGNLRYSFVGAAPSKPEIIRFFDDIGIRVMEGYGLTETSPVACGCNTRLLVPGTVGHSIADVEVLVQNTQAGETGEILIRGKNVMLGYWQEDGKYDRSIIDEDGYLHTGDLGIIDPHTKCLRITGRLKSMIVLENGKKVFPEEIETKLTEDFYIKEAMVFEKILEDGQVLLACELVLDETNLQAKWGKVIPAHEVQTYIKAYIEKVNESLPSFKRLRYVFYSLEEMIKTTTLKVKRPLERAKVEEALKKQGKDIKEVHLQYFSKEGKASPFS